MVLLQRGTRNHLRTQDLLRARAFVLQMNEAIGPWNLHGRNHRNRRATFPSPTKYIFLTTVMFAGPPTICNRRGGAVSAPITNRRTRRCGGPLGGRFSPVTIYANVGAPPIRGFAHRHCLNKFWGKKTREHNTAILYFIASFSKQTSRRLRRALVKGHPRTFPCFMAHQADTPNDTGSCGPIPY